MQMCLALPDNPESNPAVFQTFGENRGGILGRVIRSQNRDLFSRLSRPPAPPKVTGTPVKATETATLNTKTPVQQTKLSKTTPTKKKQTALVTPPPVARKTLLGS